MTVSVYHPLGGRAVQPDLFVCALGYETRAVHALSLLGKGKRNLAAAFPASKAISYPTNEGILLNAGFDISDFGSGVYSRDLRSVLKTLMEACPVEARIFVDVTSMSRPMIADTIWALNLAARVGDLNATFLYSPARYHVPMDIETCIVVSAPVTSDFAGWSTQPEQGIATIIGLGFEGEQALGTNEYLEPAGTWLFMPSGYDKRFDKAVRKRNVELIAEVGPERTFNYKLSAPIECYSVLEGLVYGLLRDSRPVLIPLGPKLFALISMLVAVQHSPQVAVWRISGERGTEPEDRLPNGKLVRIGVKFSR